jgi:type I restriction enzyme S subunit
MSRGRKSFSSSITDNWEKAFFNSIGHYITLINKGLSKSFKSESLSNHIKIVGGFAFKNAEYKSSGIPIIRISDFNNERIVLDNVVYYEESTLLEKYELKESDIIIALTGGTIGKLGIVQAGLGKLYLNQRVGKFDILSPDEFEKEYIYWIARGVESIVKNLAWGAAIPNVSPKQIEDLNFPIPTKDIQKCIIRFLNDLKNGRVNEETYFDEEIENEIKDIQEKQVKAREVQDDLSYQLSQLENLNQAILQEAVQGKLIKQDPSRKFSGEPASELLKRIKNEKATLRQAQGKGKKEKSLPPIKPEEIPFEIPENWVWCRLIDVGTTQTGTTPPTANKEFFGNNIPFIKPADISLSGIDYANEGLTLSGLEKGVLIKADSLMMVCIGGSTGKSNYTNRDVSCNQQINAIKGLCGVSGQFLQYFLQSPYFQKAIWAKSSGGTTPIVNKSKWESIPIPLPPLSEQKRIVAEISTQFAKTKQLKEHIIANQQATEQLLKALLHQAFEVK